MAIIEKSHLLIANLIIAVGLTALAGCTPRSNNNLLKEEFHMPNGGIMKLERERRSGRTEASYYPSGGSPPQALFDSRRPIFHNHPKPFRIDDRFGIWSSRAKSIYIQNPAGQWHWLSLPSSSEEKTGHIVHFCEVDKHPHARVNMWFENFERDLEVFVVSCYNQQNAPRVLFKLSEDGNALELSGKPLISKTEIDLSNGGAAIIESENYTRRTKVFYRPPDGGLVEDILGTHRQLYENQIQVSVIGDFVVLFMKNLHEIIVRKHAEQWERLYFASYIRRRDGHWENKRRYSFRSTVLSKEDEDRIIQICDDGKTNHISLTFERFDQEQHEFIVSCNVLSDAPRIYFKLSENGDALQLIDRTWDFRGD